MSITAIMTAAAAAVSAFAVTAPAAAYETAPKSVTVSYADLDMASTAGRGQLDQRIHTAARRVCGWTGPAARDASADRACRVDAVAGAQAQLTTVIAAGNGGSLQVRAR